MDQGCPSDDESDLAIESQQLLPRIFGESETVRSTCPNVISNSLPGLNGPNGQSDLVTQSEFSTAK